MRLRSVAPIAVVAALVPCAGGCRLHVNFSSFHTQLTDNQFDTAVQRRFSRGMTLDEATRMRRRMGLKDQDVAWFALPQNWRELDEVEPAYAPTDELGTRPPAPDAQTEIRRVMKCLVRDPGVFLYFLAITEGYQLVLVFDDNDRLEAAFRHPGDYGSKKPWRRVFLPANRREGTP